MISARQTKNIIDYMFGNGPAFTAPTATFSAAPASYTDDAVPAGITLTGTITPNDGIITSWTITNLSTTLASGTGNTVSHALISIPATAATYTYSLNIQYTDNNAALQSFVVPVNVTVTAASLYGQLALPADNIVIPGDLTAPIEATFTSSSKLQMVNVFSIIAANTGRIVMTIPDSFGSVTSIEDGAGLNVLSQFNAVVDVPNLRTIYVSINALTPATYDYKFIF